MIIQVPIEICYGPTKDETVYQHQIQKNIDNLKKAMEHCPFHLHTSIMDTISILEGIKKKLPCELRLDR